MGLGVFGLKSVYNRKTQDIISNVKRQYIRSYSYGYVYGGDRGNPVGPAVSNLVRIDLDTTTYFTLSAGPTDLIRSTTGSYFSSSLKYGYIVGGLRPGGVPSPSVGRTNIDRIDFSTEVISSPGAGLVSSKQGGSTGQSSAYGYYGGGYSTGTGYICTIERLDFSTSVSALISAGFPSARVRASSHSSPTIFYAVGGQVGTTPITYLSSISRLTFSTDTLSLNPSPIPAPGGNAEAGSVYTSDKGYIMGGGGTISSCLIYRLDFSTGSVGTILNPLSTVITSNHSGKLVGSRYGYLFGGTNAPLVTATSTIHRLNLSGEEVSVVPSSYGYQTRDGSTFTSTETISQTLSLNSYSFQNYSESASYGYFAGGSNNTGYPVGWQNTIDRLDLSNETTSAPGKNLLSRRWAAAVPSSVYGYFGAGGDNSAAAFVDSADKYVDRLDYSNESVSRISATLPTGGASSCGNIWSNNYGYFGGGFINLCALDRLDFSSETVQTKKVIIPRRDVYFNQNNLYGYFSGGSAAPSTFNQVERLDFSTETMQLPGNNLTASSTIGGNVSSNTYGYMARTTNTPQPNFTFTNKLDFSTETIESPSNIIFVNTHAGGISGSFVGYLAGGMPPTFAFPANTSIRKINFSTDTSNILSSTLPQGRFDLAAVSGGQSQRVLTGRTVATYGYFGGGSDLGGTPICIIDRLDFSTEIVTATGKNLTTTSRLSAVVSRSSYGYFGGGLVPAAPGFVCTIDRLDFSSETISTPGTYQLTQARYGLGGVSSSSYGYYAGGFIFPANLVNIIDRLDFSNETTLRIPSTLSQTKRYFANIQNTSYGYFGGGNIPTAVCTIDRLDFASETRSTPGTYQLSEARGSLAAVSSASYGYFGGGSTITPLTCTIDRFDFSTETRSTPGTYQLSQARDGLASVSSSSYGYFGGGVSIIPSLVNTIDRLDFFTETISAPGKNLTVVRTNISGVSNNQIASTAKKGFAPFSATYGYFMGGQILIPGPAIQRSSTVDKIDFSSETISVSNKLPSERARYATFSNSNYGYVLCGQSGVPPVNPDTCTLDRLDFSSDTFSTPNRYPTSFGLVHHTAVSSSNYGYSNHGFSAFPPTLQPTTIKLDFSNESMAALPKTTFPTEIRARGSVSSLNYGYFAGGNAPQGSPDFSTIDRLDFSTETISQPGKNLTALREDFASFSSYSYGYFDGGANYTNTDRLDFSTEIISIINQGGNNASIQAPFGTNSSNFGYYTPSLGGTCSISRLDFSTETTSTKTPLSQGRNYGNTVSSVYKPPIRNGWGWRKTYGYFVGQESPGAPPILSSLVERLDFSNETMSVPGKNLPQARGRLAAVSSSSYGYFGGGYTPTAVSTIERLDFSTDSITLPGKNLPQGKQSLAAVSSGFYGYFGGGSNPSAVLSCTINRLDFSTEIVSSPVVSPGQLTQARRDLAGTSNAGYGYFGGGSASVPTPAIFNTIDRLDFSTEIITAPGKNLSQERDSLAATSSSSYGYFGGGENISSTNVSTIERLDFSTETLNTITSSGISGISPGRRELSAVASASYGWFGGGFQNQCTINRLDFSTELTIRTGYNLSQGRSYLTGIQAN